MIIDGGGSALDAKYLNTIYHGTTTANVPGILREGIKPTHQRSNPTVGPQTYVSTSKESAEMAARGNSGKGKEPVVLHLDRNHPSVRNFKVDPEFYNSGSGRSEDFMTRNTIHPSAIKKIESVK